ncbi:DUF5416 family protein [Chryseobacterium profundimaris]|uniref:GLPGLI family protein n=1 Tax=Chryseobacterium profundimaris TaxID=1387275 RepID=A0ABY1NTK8_9FLAO|nr:DUF5416 family protein [Chryseobacterium profundimaris]SMP17599.1 hypothetical protein SAMN06264346_104142 [Chryseobacterium profundimaris]
MKGCLNVLLLCFSIALFSQELYTPRYIYSETIQNDSLKNTDNIYFFYLKPIQYIGNLKKEITLEYTESDRYSKILKNNYRSSNFKELNKEFMSRYYEGIMIFVDTTQKTPLKRKELDTLKISSEEYDAKIDSINYGLKITHPIPYITTYYDGFPVTIRNVGNRESIIGFGNNAALELEALDKENIWQKIYPYPHYSCGTGIQFFVLKPGEIATVFEPRLNGNFHTNFRYRLGNIVSNEFEGNINYNYIKQERSD